MEVLTFGIRGMGMYRYPWYKSAKKKHLLDSWPGSPKTASNSTEYDSSMHYFHVTLFTFLLSLSMSTFLNIPKLQHINSTASQVKNYHLQNNYIAHHEIPITFINSQSSQIQTVKWVINMDRFLKVESGDQFPMLNWPWNTTPGSA
jgi:hypothetical protein